MYPKVRAFQKTAGTGVCCGMVCNYEIAGQSLKQDSGHERYYRDHDIKDNL